MRAEPNTRRVRLQGRAKTMRTVVIVVVRLRAPCACRLFAMCAVSLTIAPSSPRHRAWPKLALLAAIVLAQSGIAQAQATGAPEKRMALVVGNARYPESPLNNPENDARVVGSTLRRLGFEVSEHVNLSVKDFRRVLRNYARKLQNEAGVGVFYYAGHGVQIEGRNYLLPVDVNLRDEDEVRDEAVDVDELFVSRLERARAQVRVVILDACRDNPFGDRTRSLSARGVNSGLAEMAARGALIAYASAPGATAEDGPPGTNSVYTRHLVKEMLIEGIEIEQMFKNVRVKVLRDTNQRQVPWVNTSMTANFSFNPSAKVPAVASREDLTRLQTLLEQRDREQKRLEEEIRQLRSATPGLGITPPSARASTPAAPEATTKHPTASRAKGTPAPFSTLPAPSTPALNPRVATGRKAETRPERCVELLTRAQLGEPLSSLEMTYLQKDCR